MRCLLEEEEVVVLVVLVVSGVDATGSEAAVAMLALLFELVRCSAQKL